MSYVTEANNMPQHKEEFLQWFSTADSYYKLNFLKDMTTFMSTRELKDLKNIATKAASHEANKMLEWKGPTKAEIEEMRRDAQRYAQASAPPPPVDDDERALGAAAVSALVPTMVTPVPASRSWIEDYNRENIVAIDIEKVRLRIDNTNKAAIISIISAVDLSEVYGAKIKYFASEIIVNKYTIAINGIKATDLQNGVPIGIVRKEVINRIKDKLVIVASGAEDFLSLGLEMNKFNVFDIQSYFKRPNKQDPFLAPVAVGLRDLYFYLFRKDIQRGVHSAERDAQATLEIFLEHYHGRTLNDEEVIEDTIYLKDRDIQNKFFCNIQGIFIDNVKCQCCQ